MIVPQLKVTRRGEFKEALKLKAAGPAGIETMKEIDVAANAATATATLDLATTKLPAGEHVLTVNALTSDAARQLFEERARAVESQFGQLPDNAVRARTLVLAEEFVQGVELTAAFLGERALPLARSTLPNVKDEPRPQRA